MNATATENAIEIHRLENDYAWAQCTCGNTVKFGEDETMGVCAACDTIWRCSGDTAASEGLWEETSSDDDWDDWDAEWD